MSRPLPRDPNADTPLDWTLKGLPAALEGAQKDAIGAKLNLLDDSLLFPVATLSLSALAHNSAWMRQFLALTGAQIAPHGKTTMAPDLFAMQMADGAWGMTAATAHHVRAYRQFGVDRIILANEIVGRGNADWIIAEQERHSEFEFYCLVDSADSARFLAARHAAQNASRPLRVLIEIGRVGGRTGLRSIGGAIELAQEIHAHSPHLRLAGVETFEGVFQASTDSAAQAAAMIVDVSKAAREIAALGLFMDGAILLTAGGSGFFDLAAKHLARSVPGRQVNVIIRSGCYLTHDHGMYARLAREYSARDAAAASLGAGLRPALHVWAHVQSIPEAGRVICAFGRRDAGSDADFPTPLMFARPGANARLAPVPAGHTIIGLYDQHAILTTPEDSPLRVGDLVSFGVSHPCTTFDRWRALYVVDDNLDVMRIMRTYF